MIIFVDYNALLTGQKKENIYPVYRNGLLKVIIYPGANPADVYELFCQGLVDTIYLSKNYEELDHFNAAYKNVLVTFVKKTKTPKQLYLKLESSFPDFHENENYSPYHIIRIGPVGTHPAINEVMPKAPIGKGEVLNLRLQALDNIAYELFNFRANQEMKINLSSKKVPIYSHFNKKIHEGDWKVIQEWQERFTAGHLELGPTTIMAFNEKPMDIEEQPKKDSSKEVPTERKNIQGETSGAPGI